MRTLGGLDLYFKVKSDINTIPIFRNIAMLPWNEITLKTDSNFEEKVEENSLSIPEENNNRARKISFLSFVITEEEMEDDSKDVEEGDIFTKSLAPSAFRLNLGLTEPQAFQGLNVRWFLLKLIYSTNLQEVFC